MLSSHLERKCAYRGGWSSTAASLQTEQVFLIEGYTTDVHIDLQQKFLWAKDNFFECDHVNICFCFGRTCRT